MCAAAVPVFFNVIFCAVLLPRPALPKFRLVGFALNCPTPTAVPVPVIPITSAAPLPVFATVMLPEEMPALVGANFAANVTLCDEFNVAGVVTPPTVNSLPVATTLEIVTAALPIFVSVIFCVLLLADVIVPKLKLVEFAVS
jgi:hypothetical protein